MIIEVDGYLIRSFFISEKDINHQELKATYRKIKKLGLKTEEIQSLLKEHLNLIEIQNDEGLKVDYVIDTDTDRIYKPRY